MALNYFQAIWSPEMSLNNPPARPGSLLFLSAVCVFSLFLPIFFCSLHISASVVSVFAFASASSPFPSFCF